MTASMVVVLTACIFLGICIGILLRFREEISFKTGLIVIGIVPFALFLGYPVVMTRLLKQKKGIKIKIKYFCKSSVLYFKFSPSIASDITKIIIKSDSKEKMRSKTYFMKNEMSKLSKFCISQLTAM